MSTFRFSVGPWNVHEGRDVFGPEVRASIPFAEKLARFKQIGFDAIQLHDDDAVPELDSLSPAQALEKARGLKALLGDHGLVAEFIAPRLWEHPRTIDGGYTANDSADRTYAIERSLRAIDIARELDCKRIVLWLAREGTLCIESKDPVAGVQMLVEAIDRMLAHDPEIRILIEPKPNEPIDRSFCPTIGHALAIAARTSDPDRVGGLVESAHASLAGLDPVNEMAFALAAGKLWGVHLNDQNGLKFDQDKSFGAENLRSAFNQVRLLINTGYGSAGEYIGLDVKAMRTQPIEDCYRHLENSLRVFHLLEAKARRFDTAQCQTRIAGRNYEQIEMDVLELLLNG